MTPTISKLSVSLTDEDIREGQRLSCETCPAALAIKRALAVLLPDRTITVHAGIGYIDVAFKNQFLGSYLVFKTPAAVFQFICRFDAKLPVSPFTFELDEVNA